MKSTPGVAPSPLPLLPGLTEFAPLDQSADDEILSRPFLCCVCEKGFKTKTSMKKHIQTHTRERSYGCPYCSKVYCAASDAKRHMRNVHILDSTPIVIENRREEQPSVEEFLHLENGQEENEVGRRFPPMPKELTVTDLNQKQVLKEMRIDNHQTTCPICLKDCTLTPQQRLMQPVLLKVGIISTADLFSSYSESDDLLCHIQSTHMCDWNYISSASQKDGPYGNCKPPCKMMNSRFYQNCKKSSQGPTTHLKVAIAHSVPSTSTDDCETNDRDNLSDPDDRRLFAYAQGKVAKSRIFKVASGKKRTRCSMCSEVDKRRKTHDPENKKIADVTPGEGDIESDYICLECEKFLKHKCSLCGKGFPSASSLNRHEKTHSGEKPYTCSYCDSRFAEKRNADTHIRHKHQSEVEMDEEQGNISNAITFTPPITTQVLSNSLVQKPLSLPDPLAKEEKIQVFRCPNCEVEFPQLKALQSHSKECGGDTHGKKNYVCQVCGKGFDGLFLLYGHLQMHKKEELEQEAKRRNS